jgi:hypothetical protein
MQAPVLVGAVCGAAFGAFAVLPAQSSAPPASNSAPDESRPLSAPVTNSPPKRLGSRFDPLEIGTLPPTLISAALCAMGSFETRAIPARCVSGKTVLARHTWSAC